jgi:transposase-like protein
MVYLWRAVDHEGDVLESYVTGTRDKAAALTFVKGTVKRRSLPETITTDGLRSYRAAMNGQGEAERQEVARWADNRVKDSHLPFRRRERAMLRFRQMKTLQKFASFLPTSTTTSAWSAILPMERPARNDAQSHWLSGRSLRARPPVSKPDAHHVESGSR